MKKIPLTKGTFALVDDSDYPELCKYKWQVFTIKSGIEYAKRSEIVDGIKRTAFMHREILGATTGKYVDHINRNGLDNRRFNLRFATVSQNGGNRRQKRNGSSIFKGVTRSGSKTGKLWRTSIGFNGTSEYLGCFYTQEEAASVYDEAAVFFFGDFARTNGL